jgi:hypothetical protein
MYVDSLWLLLGGAKKAATEIGHPCAQDFETLRPIVARKTTWRQIPKMRLKTIELFQPLDARCTVQQKWMTGVPVEAVYNDEVCGSFQVISAAAAIRVSWESQSHKSMASIL